MYKCINKVFSYVGCFLFVVSVQSALYLSYFSVVTRLGFALGDVKGADDDADDADDADVDGLESFAVAVAVVVVFIGDALGVDDNALGFAGDGVILVFEVDDEEEMVGFMI